MTCEVKSPDDMDASERPTIGWTRDGSGLLPSSSITNTRADQSELITRDAVIDVPFLRLEGVLLGYQPDF